MDKGVTAAARIYLAEAMHLHDLRVEAAERELHYATNRVESARVALTGAKASQAAFKQYVTGSDTPAEPEGRSCG